MSTRRQYLYLASLLGGIYGLLLGQMTGHLFPIGLLPGVLIGLLIGYGQSRHLPATRQTLELQQLSERSERSKRVRVRAEQQLRVPLHRD